MATCVICGKHVPSGPALLILHGDLDGNGNFTAKDTAGPACGGHLDDGGAIDVSKYPRVFKV